jgi:hypothetical protein
MCYVFVSAVCEGMSYSLKLCVWVELAVNSVCDRLRALLHVRMIIDLQKVTLGCWLQIGLPQAHCKSVFTAGRCQQPLVGRLLPKY